MTEHAFLPDADALAALVPDGCLLALVKDSGGVAMEATRALLRRGAAGLRLVTLPQSGIQADLLIGAGCVVEIETAAVTMGEFGLAPRFVRAVREGTIGIRDTTCPALYSAFRAGEKGIPFIPIRGLIGSDLLRFRPDYHVLDNPYAEQDPIVVVPAIQPDIALFHAPMADRAGNVWVGRERELLLMAHAARRTLVTVERVCEDDLLADPVLAAGTIPALYVEAIATAERGAWPLALPGHYGADEAHLAEYCRLAASDEGFAEYLERHVLRQRAAAE